MVLYIVGFPQVLAALHGCHVPIIAPLQSPEDYVNRKAFHAVTLQGLVYSNYRFVDILVGWPAKVHDARVFKNSPLFSHCCARTFLPLQLSRVISGVRVPPLIVGDSAYALSGWLMKPYTDNGNLTREQVNFKKILSMIRVVVENAYGRLKGRFRSIAKRLGLHVETVCLSLLLVVCCTTSVKSWVRTLMRSGCKVCSSILVFSQSTQTKDKTGML